MADSLIDPSPQAQAIEAARRAPWRRHRRHLRRAGFCAGGAALLLALAVLAVIGRFAYGPIFIDGLNQRVAAALAERLGPSWTVQVSDVVVEHAGLHPLLRVSGVDIRNPDGLRVVRAPQASVAVDVWSLMLGRFTPRAVSFSGLDLRVVTTKDGSLAFIAGDAADIVRATPAGVGLVREHPPLEAGAAGNAPASVALAAASLMDLMTTTEGLFGSLDSAGINGARLIVLDGDNRERASFRDVALTFTKAADNQRRFSLGLNGAAGRWDVEGSFAGGKDTQRTAAISFGDVAVSDLLVLTGKSGNGFTSDMPLSGQVHVAVAPDGGLKVLDTDIKGGRAIVHIDDPDMPTVAIDDLAIATAWDAPTGTIDIRRIAVVSGGSRGEAQGKVTAGSAGAPWQMTLTGKDWVVERLSPAEAPLTIDRFDAQITAASGGGVLLDRVAIAGAKFGVAISGSIGTEADSGGLRLGITGSRSSARAVLRLWPAFSAPHVRAYLIRNVRDGIVERLSVAISMSQADIKIANAKGPIADAAVKAEYALSGVELTPSDSLPPLKGGSVSGTASGRTAFLTVPQATLAMADGRTLQLSEGSFAVPDSSAPHAPTSVSFRLAGGADALVAALSSEALKGVMPVALDPAGVKGLADLRVALALPLERNVSMADVQVTGSGSLTGLGLDNVVGKDKLEGANLAVNLDRAALSLKGEGRIAGLQGSIDLKQPMRGGGGEVILATVLDDAARAKRGLAFGKQLTGPIGIRINAPLVKGERKGPRIEADLAKASIDDLVPGWSKPAGRPGRAAFTLVDRPNGGYLLDEFALDGGIVAKGTLAFSADGNLDAANLSPLKLSPGDDMKLDLERTATGYKVNIKGAVIDARPLLKAVTNGADARDAGKDQKEGKDLDLDLSANILAGYNDEAITASTLKLSKRGKDIRQLQLAGRFGKVPITAQLLPRDKQPGVIVLQTEDAGALLRFTDLYKRMVGGGLTLQVAVSDTRQAGTLVVRAFSLKNEPALGRIVSQQPTGSTGANDDRASQAVSKIDTTDVPFSKLKADFTRTAGRLELKEAVIWGSQVGINIDGFVDFARDKVGFNGTYVPAYALNNVFSQVPLFGPLLGGGQTEGLFAVSFRVTGAASAPTLTINPLTAVAPGIFRKFIEAFTPDGSRDTGSIAPVPPAPLPGDR